MNWYQSLSLLSKQILIIVLINAISLLIAATLYFYNNVNDYKDRQINEIDSKAQVIGSTLTTALLFQDAHAAHEQLKNLSNDKHVLYAGVFDANQNFFANYISSGHYERPDLKRIKPGLSTKNGKISLLKTIYLDDELMGYIYLAEDTKNYKHQLINHALITLLVFVFSLLLAYTLSLMMRRWLVKPIQDLLRLIQHITSSNDFSQRLQSGSNDEIGQLIHNFNAMIDAIQLRDLKLKAQGDELQDLVNLRTRQLHQRANYDNLTKLPNRHFFVEKLSQTLYVDIDPAKFFAVGFVDLDRFKHINDVLGHNTGDKVLSIIAKRLTQVLSTQENVARWGGDEFVFFVKSISKPELDHLLDQVMQALQAPILFDQKEFQLSACIGVSIYPKDATDALNLLKRANVSANKAKAKGAAQLMYYQPEMDENIKDQLSLETKLRKAIAGKALSLVYQPKVSVKTGQLTGVEALIRWYDEDLGFVPPGQFIPVAEEIGLIGQIGEFVIESACKQHAQWRLMGLTPIKIALNLSPTHLADETLLSYIEEQLSFYQVDTQYIELEITEETFLDADQLCMQNLHKLKNSGLSIALDDFGTGYSCLSYLVDIPVSTLKIDGSFIRKIGTRTENDGIVKAILTLGQGLGLEVVAECVETKAQWQFLKDAGCDTIQGYYFSKPLKPEQLQAFINNRLSKLTETQALEKLLTD